MIQKKQFFIHIKKTAGTSLVSLIQRNYDWHREILYQASTWREIWHQNPRKLSHAKFIRGHFGINLLKLLPENIDRFTFLRDPVQRCLSDLNFAHLTKSHWPHEILRKNQMTAKDALFHPGIEHYCRNHLLANLGMEVPIENLWANRPAIVKTSQKFKDFLDSSECLEKAKEYLNSCYFTGITEYFTLSYIFLCYLNFWRPDLQTEEYHKGDKSWIKATIGPDEIEYLNKANKNDFMLYDYGKQKFEDQIRSTFPDLVGSTSINKLDKKEITYLEKKIYDLTMTQYYQDFKNNPVLSEWDAAMPLHGCGWHDVHSPEMSPHRWSGPGTYSELDIRLDDFSTCKMTIILRGVMAPDIISKLQVSVNHHSVHYRVSSQKENRIQIDFEIDKNMQENGYVSVGLLTPRTVSPAELDAKNHDTLKRGIAIEKYFIKPA